MEFAIGGHIFLCFHEERFYGFTVSGQGAPIESKSLDALSGTRMGVHPRETSGPFQRNAIDAVNFDEGICEVLRRVVLGGKGIAFEFALARKQSCTRASNV